MGNSDLHGPDDIGNLALPLVAGPREIAWLSAAARLLGVPLGVLIQCLDGMIRAPAIRVREVDAIRRYLGIPIPAICHSFIEGKVPPRSDGATLRWSPKRRRMVESPMIDAFLAEVLVVCRRHGYALWPGSGPGKLAVLPLCNEALAWLRAANDGTDGGWPFSTGASSAQAISNTEEPPMRYSSAQREFTDTPEIDTFLEEVISVCRKHGYAIGHQDVHGGFEIMPFSEETADWLWAAADATGGHPWEDLNPPI